MQRGSFMPMFLFDIIEPWLKPLLVVFPFFILAAQIFLACLNLQSLKDYFQKICLSVCSNKSRCGFVKDQQVYYRIRFSYLTSLDNETFVGNI